MNKKLGEKEVYRSALISVVCWIDTILESEDEDVVELLKNIRNMTAKVLEGDNE